MNIYTAITLRTHIQEEKQGKKRYRCTASQTDTQIVADKAHTHSNTDSHIWIATHKTHTHTHKHIQTIQWHNKDVSKLKNAFSSLLKAFPWYHRTIVSLCLCISLSLSQHLSCPLQTAFVYKNFKKHVLFANQRTKLAGACIHVFKEDDNSVAEIALMTR